jgi:hypothetical protein
MIGPNVTPSGIVGGGVGVAVGGTGVAASESDAISAGVAMEPGRMGGDALSANCEVAVTNT